MEWNGMHCILRIMQYKTCCLSNNQIDLPQQHVALIPDLPVVYLCMVCVHNNTHVLL